MRYIVILSGARRKERSRVRVRMRVIEKDRETVEEREREKERKRDDLHDPPAISFSVFLRLVASLSMSFLRSA
jgi:hypothetical protein